MDGYHWSLVFSRCTCGPKNIFLLKFSQKMYSTLDQNHFDRLFGEAVILVKETQEVPFTPWSRMAERCWLAWSVFNIFPPLPCLNRRNILTCQDVIVLAGRFIVSDPALIRWTEVKAVPGEIRWQSMPGSSTTWLGSRRPSTKREDAAAGKSKCRNLIE